MSPNVHLNSKESQSNYSTKNFQLEGIVCYRWSLLRESVHLLGNQPVSGFYPTSCSINSIGNLKNTMKYTKFGEGEKVTRGKN
jgi:hypothetical protein